MESELASLQQFICGINICQLLHMQGCLRDGSHKALLKTVPTLIFLFSVNDTSNIQLSNQKSRGPSSSFPKTFPTQSNLPAFVWIHLVYEERRVETLDSCVQNRNNHKFLIIKVHVNIIKLSLAKSTNNSREIKSRLWVIKQNLTFFFDFVICLVSLAYRVLHAEAWSPHLLPLALQLHRPCAERSTAQAPQFKTSAAALCPDASSHSASGAKRSTPAPAQTCVNSTPLPEDKIPI